MLRLAGRLFGVALCGALMLLGALPAVAKDFAIAVDGRLLGMGLAGHKVQVPGPLWTKAGELVDIEKSQVIYKLLEPGIESVLFLPAEENLVTWTRLMGVLAVERPGYTAALQTASMVQPVMQSCAQGQVIASKIAAQTPGGRDGLLLMCGRYNPTSSKPRNCAAGIVVAVVLESKKGAMKVYDEWCTAAFDVNRRESWPVSGEELQRHATELQLASAFEALAE
jgi:hypothetical protein